MMLPLPSGALEKGSIVIRLLVPSPMVCIGQPTFDLEAVLTNTSQEAVVLSQDGVAHSISYRKYENDKPIDGTGLLLDIKPDHWIKVAPNQSVIIPFTEPLSEKLFGELGLFSVQIEFGVILKNREQYAMFPGTVLSNQAFFLVTNCRKPHP
jgi:hypothetical protein